MRSVPISPISPIYCTNPFAMRFFTLLFGLFPFLLFAQAHLFLPEDPQVVAVPLDWRGHNLSAAARWSWVTHPEFEDLLPVLRPGFIRWPYGNPANDYDWLAGLGDADGFHLAHAAAFAKNHGTKLQAVVPYGNRSAAHAADLVRFCNSTAPAWAALRDSLLGSPDPLGIEVWEIGNEVTTAWGFAWSWLGYQDTVRFRTGQPAMTWTQRQIDSLYFYGGAFPRFGWVERIGGLNARTAVLGDLVFVPQATDTLVHTLHFPEASLAPDSVRVWVAPAMGSGANLSQQAIYDYLTQPQHLLPQNEYTWNATTFTLFPAGGLPDSTAVLIEYVSTGHDGAFDFLEAMRAADPDIRIGYCTRVSEELAANPQFVADLKQHLPDFIVEHPYATNLSVPAAAMGLHSELVWLSEFKLDQMRDRQQLWHSRAEDWQLPWTPGLALTEWNVALCDGCPDPHPFRGMGGALYVARFQARLIELAAQDSLLLHASNHFGLIAGGDNFLHLFHVNGGQFRIGNEGYAMLMAMEALADGIVLPRPELTDVPWLALQQPDGLPVPAPALEVWAGFGESQDTWRLLVLNADSAFAHSMVVHLPQGYVADTVEAYLLTGPLNGGAVTLSTQSWAVQADSFELTVPEYALALLAFRQMTGTVGTRAPEPVRGWDVRLATFVEGGIRLFAQADQHTALQWQLLHMDGRIAAQGRLRLPAGASQPVLDVPVPVAGACVLRLYDESHQLALKLMAFR